MTTEKTTRKSESRKNSANILAGIGIITVLGIAIWFGWSLIERLIHTIAAFNPAIRAALIIATAIAWHASVIKSTKTKE